MPQPVSSADMQRRCKADYTVPSGMQRLTPPESGYPSLHKTVGKTNQSAVKAAANGIPWIAFTASVKQPQLEVELLVLVSCHD